MATDIVAEDAKLPEHVGIPELAAYLDVPVSTIYAWRSRRVGPPGFKVGKRVRFLASDVEAWLKEMREAGFPASEPLADENVDDQPTAA